MVMIYGCSEASVVDASVAGGSVVVASAVVVSEDDSISVACDSVVVCSGVGSVCSADDSVVGSVDSAVDSAAGSVFSPVELSATDSVLL